MSSITRADSAAPVARNRLKRALQIMVCLGFAAWCGTILMTEPEIRMRLFPLAIAFSLALLSLIGASGAFAASVMATLVGFAVWEASRWSFILPVGLLWCVWGIVQSFLRREESEVIDLYLEARDLEKEKHHADEELHFYRRRASEAAGKASHRRLLSAAARELGGELEGRAILMRLLTLSRDLFPQGAPRFSPGNGADRIDRWVVERRQALVVPDIARDVRFQGHESPALRSVMAVPLKVGGNLSGIMRVEAESPDIFSREDLRVLDMLSGLAALALENASLFERVKTLSLRDGLTGLFTQRVFWERLEEEILRAGRYGHPLSLILCDIDHFKAINDNHGHPAGDAALVRISQSLQIRSRPVDVVARYGGEEFGLILPQFTHNQAVKQAESIRQAIAQEELMYENRRISMTISLGVATFPLEATTGRALMRLADGRLYKAKEQGRNRVVAEDK